MKIFHFIFEGPGHLKPDTRIPMHPYTDPSVCKTNHVSVLLCYILAVVSKQSENSSTVNPPLIH